MKQHILIITTIKATAVLAATAILASICTTACNSGGEAEGVSFGVVADIQYDRQAPDKKTRRYTLGVQKIGEAVQTFKGVKNLAFMEDLGDMTDRNCTHYEDIAAVKKTLGKPCYNIFGNHDFRPSALEEEFKEAAALKGLQTPYYAVREGGVRFIFLNTSDVATHSAPKGSAEYNFARQWLDSLKAADNPCAKDYNGAVGREQLTWLEEELAAADLEGEPVIVNCHMLLMPLVGKESLWNSAEVVAILEAHPCVKAVFCGHRHDGGYDFVNGIHYVNFLGMVEGETNRYAVVTVKPAKGGFAAGGKITIDGYGDEPDRELEF